MKLMHNQSSPANKARLLSVSAPHTTSWLSVITLTSLALHDPIEFRVAVKWLLGLHTSQGYQCGFCPAHSLDPLGHHALTCKCRGDVISRHNALRDTLARFLHRAYAAIEVEAGAGSFLTIHSHNLLIFSCSIGNMEGPLPWTSLLSHR